MTDSILDYIKDYLNIELDCTDFDNEIIGGINTVLNELHQMGIRSDTYFSITDKSDLWSTYFNGGQVLELAKSYIKIKVKLMFDPPSSQTLIDMLKDTVNELGYRILVYSDGYEEA